MPKIFERLGMSKPRYSGFDLSREQKLSCEMTELVPTLVEELVPGDHFRVKSEMMLRFMPMLAPIYNRVDVYMHYFFVPNRLLWSGWEEFITGGQDGDSAPVMPTLNLNNIFGGHQRKKLVDFMGIDPDLAESNNLKVNALPFGAYQAIWSEYYRDPNLDDEINVKELMASSMSPSDQQALMALRWRALQKDYFTSALPFTQRGPAVEASAQAIINKNQIWKKETNDQDPATGSATFIANKLRDSGSQNVYVDNIIDSINIDLNELRRASALQRFLEKNARGGYRYIEQILSHFGVQSSDKRLQRPEYLGGGKAPVNISEVLTTASSEQASTSTEWEPGAMVGHGLGAGITHGFDYKAEEHGFIMGIMSVLPKVAYMQGVHRKFMRNDRLDYYWPEFANLGEQPIYNNEIYIQDADSEQSGVFGYQQRYAEYKYGTSTVHGQFRDSLDYWHLARKFDSPPALNGSFMRLSDSEYNRIFNVPEAFDHVLVQMYHEVKAKRPMPFFANPQLS